MWYACIYAAGKKKKAKKRAKPAASPRWAQTGPAKSQWKVKGQEPREPFCHSISDSSVRVVRNFRKTRSSLRLIHTTIVPPPLSFVSRNPPRPSIFLLAFVFFCFMNPPPPSRNFRTRDATHPVAGLHTKNIIQGVDIFVKLYDDRF